MTGGVVVGGLALLAFTVVMAMRRKRQTAEVWKRFAHARGLGFSEGRVAGMVGGFLAAVLTEKREDSDTSWEVAVVRVSLDGLLPAAFSLTPETIGSRLSQVLGEPDHQLGVPEMDAAFWFENLGDTARKVLSERGAQQALLSCRQRYPSLMIGKGTLQLELRAVPSTEEALARLLDDALAVATALRKAAPR